MIQGVAQQVDQGLEQPARHVLVDRDLAALDHQLCGLAELTRELPRLARQAVEQGRQGGQPQPRHRAMQVRQRAVERGLTLEHRPQGLAAGGLSDGVGQGVLGDDRLVQEGGQLIDALWGDAQRSRRFRRGPASDLDSLHLVAHQAEDGLDLRDRRMAQAGQHQVAVERIVAVPGRPVVPALQAEPDQAGDPFHQGQRVVALEVGLGMGPIADRHAGHIGRQPRGRGMRPLRRSSRPLALGEGRLARGQGPRQPRGGDTIRLGRLARSLHRAQPALGFRDGLQQEGDDLGIRRACRPRLLQPVFGRMHQGPEFGKVEQGRRAFQGVERP